MKQLDLFGMMEQTESPEANKLPVPEIQPEETVIAATEPHVVAAASTEQEAIVTDRPVAAEATYEKAEMDTEAKATEAAAQATEQNTQPAIAVAPAESDAKDNISSSKTGAAFRVLRRPDIIEEAQPVELLNEESDTPASGIAEPANSAAETEPAPEGQVVFSDDKISVKIKLKENRSSPEPELENGPVEVQLPATPVPDKAEAKRPVMVMVKKRGRKSFREIDLELELVEVPDDETLFQKQYYAISQVAQWFHVNTSLVRYWENEFDILKPRKNRKGDRLFRPEDVKSLQVIYYLLRQRKFSIEGAKKYLKENRKSADTNIQLIQSLTKFRSFLLELKANLGA